MNVNKRLFFSILAVAALSGCAHHSAPSESKQTINANKNAINHALSGGPMTSKTRPITDFRLGGYSTTPHAH